MLDGLVDLLEENPVAAAAAPAKPDPLRLSVGRDLRLSLGFEKADLPPVKDPLADEFGVDPDEVSELRQIARGHRLATTFRYFSREMGAFASEISGLEGRRLLVLFGRGAQGSLFFGAGGPTSAMTQLRVLAETLRRSGWEIQAVDPRPVGPFGVEMVDPLVTFAADTGGQLYRSYGNLEVAMESLLERTAASYLLAFQLEKGEEDSHRRIRVKLRDIPWRARVHHRKGHRPPRPENTGFGRAVAAADRIVFGEPAAEIELRSWLVPLEMLAGKRRMAARFSIPGEQLAAGGAGDQVKLEVYAYALGAGGEVADFWVKDIFLRNGLAAKLARDKAPFLFAAELALPPGSYRLRLLIRDVKTGRETLATWPLEAPGG